jgi:hypothetical protein
MRSFKILKKQLQMICVSQSLIKLYVEMYDLL